MSLIDETYFTGELLIPNLDDSTPAGEANMDLWQWFLDKYEKQLLIALLGETLYDEFMAGLEIEPIPEKWTDLRDALVDSAVKVSPIANFVYFHYLKNQASQSVGAGEVTTATENAVRISPSAKMVGAWNAMVDMLDEVDEWITDNEDTYTSWDMDDLFWYNYQTYINTFDI